MTRASHSSSLDRLLEPLADCLTLDSAERIVVFKADEATQQRLDELAEKANRGALTPAEDDEYRTHIAALDLIAILHAKARTMLRKRSG